MQNRRHSDPVLLPVRTVRKHVRILTILAAALTTSFGFSACGGGGGDGIVNPGTKPDAVTAVSLTASLATIEVGGTSTLTPTVSKGNSAATVTTSYTSSAPAIVSVTADGVATGVSPGAATITVTASGSGTCCNSNSRAATTVISVNALPPALTGTFTVTPNPGSVLVGATVPLVPNVIKATGAVNVAYTYSSNQSSIASVNSAGVVTGVSPGQAVITVVATGSATGFTTTVQTAVTTVTVSPGTPALGTLTLTTSAGSTIAVGLNTNIIANANPAAGATVTTSYLSANTAVATVSQTGVVTAIAAGTSVITVTAMGSGTGLTQTTRTAMLTITVTAAPCSIVNATLDFSRTGSIVATDCLFGAGPGKASWVRVDPTQPVTAVSLQATTTGFASVAVVAAASTATSNSLVFNGASGSASGIFLLPAGPSFLGVVSNTGTLGSYTFSATRVAEDFVGCRFQVIFATLTTTQTLDTQSCLPNTGNNRFDRFAIFAPGRSCTVDMRLAIVQGNPPPAALTDPYIEAWSIDGVTKVAEDDDGGDGIESRLTFQNCAIGTNGIIEIRARAFDATEFGLYRLTVTFGP